jgi:hypothetical protein
VLGLALAQLPAAELDREIVARTDIGGQTHQFTRDCREANIGFSVGYELTETVRAAILDLPESSWVQAINADGDRDGAWVEDSIRAGKDTGMRNLPHHAFEHNQTWLETSLMAQDLLTWTKLIRLDGELARAEPKRLRQRALHIAAKGRPSRAPHPPQARSRLAVV